MALMKTSNPALGENTFRGLSDSQYGGLTDLAGRMTLSGTVNKTGVLLLCAIATAWWTWHLFLQSHDVAAVAPLMLGGLSATLELHYPGIAIQAVSLTFGTLFVLLMAYRSGLIKVTQKFRLGIIAATGGIMVFYLLQMVMGFFGFQFTSINGSGPIGIGFSLIVVAIAALNLVLDFDFIEQGVQYGAPKYMEWYGAFGIMVFIFLSVLRKPKTIPTGYHYRFDSATNGPRLVRDQPPEE